MLKVFLISPADYLLVRIFLDYMKTMKTDCKLTTNSTSVVRLLALSSLTLIVLSTIGQFAIYFLPDFPLRDPFFKLFSLDIEKNVPSLFSGLLLLICAFLLLFISIMLKRASSRAYYRHWLLLGIIFVYLSADEVFSFHEKTIAPMRELGFDSGFLFYSWIVIAIPIVSLVGLFYLRFLFHLPNSTRNAFLTAAVLYIGGAIFIESIGAYHADTFGVDSFTHSFIFTLEESLEIFGILIFMNALFGYIRNTGIENIKVNFILTDKIANGKIS